MCERWLDSTNPFTLSTAASKDRSAPLAIVVHVAAFMKHASFRRAKKGSNPVRATLETDMPPRRD